VNDYADLPNNAPTEVDTYFFRMREAATNTEGAVNALVNQILRMTQYTRRPFYVVQEFCYDWVMSGELQPTKADFAVVHAETMQLLILAEDKSNKHRGDPEAQIIAQAISAYQYNNMKRAEADLPEIDAWDVPCLTMRGTQPKFYVVPVTKMLSKAVEGGEKPVGPTTVFRCKNPVRGSYGAMSKLVHRIWGFNCFFALRKMAEGMGAPMFEGMIGV